MNDRIAYTRPTNTVEFREHYLSGRIVWEDGKFWLAQYHVAYAQSGMDTSSNYSCRAKADFEFEKRLADIRKGWGHKGGRWSEESTNHVRGIRFRSIRKNGKAGTLTGTLYMTDMRSVTQHINDVPSK